MKPLSFLKSTLAALGAMALLASSPVAVAQSGPQGDGGTIRMLITPVGTMSIPPEIIRKFGLDKKYNIRIETVPYSNQNSVAVALQGKSAEVVAIDWLAMARLRGGGVGVVGVAPFMTYVNSMVVPKDSPIRTLADLSGKKVGVPNKTGFDWMITLAAARKQYKVDLNKTVQVQEGAVPLLRGLMDRNELEATQMWNSLAPEMIASGKYKSLLTIRQIAEQMGLPTVPYLLFGMREDYAREHPANARAFVAMYQDAAEILMTNDQIWTEQAERMKISPQALGLFKKQVRRDLIRKFTPDMSAGIDATFNALLEVAGPDVLGMKAMPAGLLTLDYQ